jgi:hypothetical protein
MGEEHRSEFLQSCKLLEWQKEEVRQASDKNERYSEFIVWHELDDAIEASVKCHDYLQTNGIFLKQEMKDSFSQLDNLIWKAIKERQSILRYGPGSGGRTPMNFPGVAEPLMNELETNVRRRLHE